MGKETHFVLLTPLCKLVEEGSNFNHHLQSLLKQINSLG